MVPLSILAGYVSQVTKFFAGLVTSRHVGTHISVELELPVTPPVIPGSIILKTSAGILFLSILIREKNMSLRTTDICPPKAAPVSDQSSQTDHQKSLLPIYCPGCGDQIHAQIGLCGHRFVEAILLQARHIGTELSCQSCNTTFVYSQVTPLDRS